MVDISELQSQAQKVSQAQQRSTELAGQSATLPDLLRQAVSERFQSSPLFGQREQAVQQVLTSPTRSREQLAETVKGGTIMSPTQQQSVLAAQRAADVVPLMSINDLLRTQTGGIEGLISSGTGAFQNLVTQAQGTAQQEQNTLSNLLNIAKLEEDQRQFNLSNLLEQQRLALAAEKASQPSADQQKRTMQIDEGLSSLDAARKEIQNAMQVLQSGQNVSGGTAGFARGFRERIQSGSLLDKVLGMVGLGAPKQDTTALEGRLANINERIFETSGKALTGTEVEILLGKIPRIGQDESQMMTTLQELEQSLVRKQQNLILEAATGGF